MNGDYSVPGKTFIYTNPIASSHDIWQISDDDPPALFFRELMLIIEHRVGIG